MFRIRNLLAFVLLCSWVTFAAEPRPHPDLTGYWKLDVIHSTAAPADMQASQVVISEFGNRLEFEFRAGHKVVSREYFTTDGIERPRYRSRLETASAKAKFEKDQLVIVTRSALDNEGLQQYTETDRWFLSKDGKVLTNKMTDGKLRIYEKGKPPEPEPQVPGSPGGECSVDRICR